MSSTSGWTDRNVRAKSAVIAASLYVLPLVATAGDPADTPDIQLLEFLGEWETSQGKWIDPMDIPSDDAGDRTKTKVKTKGGEGQDEQ
jgi:hypothetical protein